MVTPHSGKTLTSFSTSQPRLALCGIWGYKDTENQELWKKLVKCAYEVIESFCCRYLKDESSSVILTTTRKGPDHAKEDFHDETT
jgi:hypothetical protein